MERGETSLVLEEDFCAVEEPGDSSPLAANSRRKKGTDLEMVTVGVNRKPEWCPNETEWSSVKDGSLSEEVLVDVTEVCR